MKLVVKIAIGAAAIFGVYLAITLLSDYIIAKKQLFREYNPEEDIGIG